MRFLVAFAPSERLAATCALLNPSDSGRRTGAFLLISATTGLPELVANFAVRFAAAFARIAFAATAAATFLLTGLASLTGLLALTGLLGATALFGAIGLLSATALLGAIGLLGAIDLAGFAGADFVAAGLPTADLLAADLPTADLLAAGADLMAAGTGLPTDLLSALTLATATGAGLAVAALLDVVEAAAAAGAVCLRVVRFSTMRIS